MLADACSPACHCPPIRFGFTPAISLTKSVKKTGHHRLPEVPWYFRSLQKLQSVLLALRHFAPRQADCLEHRRVDAERLVHVRNDLHQLVDQVAVILDHFGDEVGADRLAVAGRA